MLVPLPPFCVPLNGDSLFDSTVYLAIGKYTIRCHRETEREMSCKQTVMQMQLKWVLWLIGSLHFVCSCEMVFGEIPGSKEDDEAYSQPCLQSCPSAKTSQRKCVKLQ